MKRTTKPYIQFLVRQNLAYFAIFIGLMAASGFLVPFFIAHLSKTNASLKSEQESVAQLESKKRILESLITENGADIDQDLTLITKLIPDSEDYFSMIYALERLSQTSGFSINNYIVNLNKSTESKLALTVSGQGNTDAFLNLLRTYTFSGGRLITAEKIGIDPLRAGDVSLSLNFYNDNPSSRTNEHLDFQSSIQELNELRQKVQFSLVDSGDAPPPEQSESYPTKQNLF